MLGPFVCQDGTHLHLREDGDLQAALTLVLLHCYALDLRVWDPVVERLTARRPVRVVRYDHRGHGGSDPATRGTDLAQLGDDLADLLAHHLPEGPVVLVGHSMGGMAIMAMADRHPELVADRVAGAAFIATSSSNLSMMSLGLPRPLASALLTIERLGMTLLSAVGRENLPCPGAILGPFVRWLAFGTDARPVEVANVTAMARDCRLGNIATLRRTLDEHDCRLALITFDRLPTIVLVGDQDRLTSVRHAAVITQWLPHARLHVLPGAGHMLPCERTATIVDLLARLVDHAIDAWRGAADTESQWPARRTGVRLEPDSTQPGHDEGHPPSRTER